MIPQGQPQGDVPQGVAPQGQPHGDMPMPQGDAPQAAVPPGAPDLTMNPVASGSATPPSSEAVPIAPATQDLGEIPLDDPTLATAAGNRPGPGMDHPGGDGPTAAVQSGGPFPAAEHATTGPVPVAAPAPAAGPAPAHHDHGRDHDVEIRLDPVELALCADLMRVTSMGYEQVTGRLAALELRADLHERLRDVRLELTLLAQELEEEARVLDIRREAAESRLR